MQNWFDEGYKPGPTHQLNGKKAKTPPSANWFPSSDVAQARLKEASRKNPAPDLPASEQSPHQHLEDLFKL